MDKSPRPNKTPRAAEARARSGPSRSPLPAPPDRRRFRQRLLTWYRRHGRDLPWRKTDDPYHILVSEIMLQQTQVDRVLPKYAEWLDKYPSFDALASAPEQRGDRHLVSARLQHQAQTPAEHRARGRGPVRRPAAGRRGDAAVVQGHRRVHRRGHPQLRVRRARRHSRHQRRAGAVSRVRRRGRSEEPRHEAPSVGGVGRARARPSRVRLQPGADGLRRDGLRRAENPKCLVCPMAKRLPRVSLHRRHDHDCRHGRGRSKTTAACS